MQATRLLIRRLAPAIFILTLLGCSKSVDPKPFTNSQLLTGTTSKTWRLRTVQLIEKNSAPVNFTLPPCYLNDSYIFYADSDKKFEFQHLTKCSDKDSGFTFTDSWSLVNANATINFPFLVGILSPNISSFNFTVKLLSKTDMTLEYYDPLDEYSYRFQFTSQGG